MRKIDLIVVHCSATDETHQDSIEAVRELHISNTSKKFKWGPYDTFGKGFSDIGYHYLITKDGTVHTGRPLGIAGAHVRGYNSRSIGICLSGRDGFTPEQFRSLERLCRELVSKFNLTKLDILAHHDLDKGKTCPNFKVSELVATWKL